MSIRVGKGRQKEGVGGDDESGEERVGAGEAREEEEFEVDGDKVDSVRG